MENEPSTSAPVPVSGETWRQIFDTRALFIIGFFVLISLGVVALLITGYRHGRNTELAERYVAARQYDKAIPYLNRIIDKYPDAWFRIKQLGDCYMYSGKPGDAKKAMEYYKRVQDSPAYQWKLTNPQTAPDERKNLDVNEELGICASLMGDATKAQEYFAKVLDKDHDPESPAANFYLGVQCFNAGDFKQAARYFQITATGDQLPTTVNAAELDGPRPSKWGKYWDEKAEPYRKQIAKRVLEAPLTPAPAPAAAQRAKKG